MKHWRVGVRLGAGYALVLALLVAVTVLGIVQMTKTQDRLEQIADVNNAKARLATAMRDTVYERMIALSNIVLLSDAADTAASAAAASLQGQAVRLALVVSQFKLDVAAPGRALASPAR